MYILFAFKEYFRNEQWLFSTILYNSVSSWAHKNCWQFWVYHCFKHLWVAMGCYGLQRSTASYFGSTRIVLSSIHGFQTKTILEQSNEQPSLFISSITKPFVISIWPQNRYDLTCVPQPITTLVVKHTVKYNQSKQIWQNRGKSDTKMTVATKLVTNICKDIFHSTVQFLDTSLNDTLLQFVEYKSQFHGRNTIIEQTICWKIIGQIS